MIRLQSMQTAPTPHPFPRTYAYSVSLEIPIIVQSCLTGYCRCWYSDTANRCFSRSSAGGRPPQRPRARAAANPAWVRSRIRLRSNSANAPNRWKISRPPGEGVSIDSCRLRKPPPLLLSRFR